ncbi:hypothetical protein D3C85_1767670 [compost metagenome]
MLSPKGELPKSVLPDKIVKNEVDTISKEKGGLEVEGTAVDFDYKEWADMPVSGEVRIAFNGQR